MARTTIHNPFPVMFMAHPLRSLFSEYPQAVEISRFRGISSSCSLKIPNAADKTLHACKQFLDIPLLVAIIDVSWAVIETALLSKYIIVQWKAEWPCETSVLMIINLCHAEEQR